MNLFLKLLPSKHFSYESVTGLALVQVVSKTSVDEDEYSDLYSLKDILLIPFELIKKVHFNGEELYLITNKRLLEYQSGMITKWAN